jgi:hypothetical protein
MHVRICELPQPHPIYLLPPHEHLSSVLRRTFAPRAPPHVVHTSFAWLGHGALVPRADAAAFLALLHALNASATELRMADNYFALLANRIPEAWLDQGIELGGGQPFTVGSEGDERNKRHFRRAAEFLDQISGCRGEDCSAWTYANLSAVIAPGVERDRLTKAACRGRFCVLETNIRLLPELDHIADRAQDVLEVETRNTAALGGDGHLRYVDFALSHAVDGSLTTAFKSRGRASVKRCRIRVLTVRLQTLRRVIISLWTFCRRSHQQSHSGLYSWSTPARCRSCSPARFRHLLMVFTG